MTFKTIALCTLTLSLLACSEEMLTPTYGDNKPENYQHTHDGKTRTDKPFSFVVGSWIDETGGTVVHIDNIGHFVMRSTHSTNSTEEKGYLEDVSTSSNINDLRFELYRENKEKMYLAFGVKEINGQRHLVMFDGSSALTFRPM